VIYIGDGLATSGEIGGQRLQAALRRSLATSRARLFTVAVGGEANHGFLDALAHAGGGRSLRVGTSEEAGSRALELVAALKTPTVTDFELDAGAGLDEVFTSADGKVSWGGELMLLARSHHDLPSKVKVKGRLGGQAFEKSYSVSEEKESVAALVPRFWAAAYMNKILGEVGGADEQRGTLVKLGLDYGLMTPFTSFLALESEQAYAAQGIARKKQPGSGRLAANRPEPKAKDGIFVQKNVMEEGKMGDKARRLVEDEQAAPEPSALVARAAPPPAAATAAPPVEVQLKAVASGKAEAVGGLYKRKGSVDGLAIAEKRAASSPDNRLDMGSSVALRGSGGRGFPPKRDRKSVV
jgi:hypothetical protein